MKNTKHVVERSAGPLLILALIVAYGVILAVMHTVESYRARHDDPQRYSAKTSTAAVVRDKTHKGI